MHISETLSRAFGSLAALAVLWIVVYWYWEPRKPVVSFDAAAETAVQPLAAEPGWASASRPPAPAMEEARTPPAAPAPLSGGRRESGTPTVPGRVERATPAVIPPQFRDYAIREGDTLEAIARRELGAARHWPAIVAANPLMSPDRLQIGRMIKIPVDPANIQGKPSAAAAETGVEKPAPEAAVEYTVRSGDSLSKIAKDQYGSAQHKDFLYASNRDRLRSEDDLKIGQKLRLPPLPTAPPDIR